MAYTYTTINGQRVQTDVANAFSRLNSAFNKAFGLSLLVTSGTRTTAEQRQIFLSRFRAQSSGNGPYNDVRFYNGVRYVRVSSAGTVAVPGTSNHEEGGPIGPRALDIRDSGSNAGVTTAGNARSNWIRNNARSYSFNPAGYNFGEPWHIEYTGSFGGGSSSGGGNAGGNQTLKNQQNWLNVARGENLVEDGVSGPATVAAFKRYQTFLRSYGYTGDIDGQWGAGTQAAHQRYYDEYMSKGLITVDGQWGPATTKKLQAVLGVAQDGDMGPASWKALQGRLGVAQDGVNGPTTTKALQRVLGVNQDGEIGPATVTALQNYLNNGGTFSTTPPVVTPPADEKLVVDGNWGTATTKAFQKRLGVTVDGQLGPDTWKAFQKATGQTQDGQTGPMTYKALQMNVGAAVDGSLGQETTKKLQEFLNAGKKFFVVVVPVDSPVVTYPKPAAPTYPEAGWWDHSPNSSPRREGDKVQYFVVHHAADTRDVVSQRDRFMVANDRNVSPNWLIGKDGSVSEIVPPDKFRAWTSGQFDYNAVTVETQNTSGDPTWGISEESHISIAKLVAWAADRYGFPIDRTHVIGHREVPGAATACPGPSMNLEKIVQYAVKFAGQVTEPEVPEVPSEDKWVIEISKDEAVAAGKAIDESISLLSEVRKLYP